MNLQKVSLPAVLGWHGGRKHCKKCPVPGCSASLSLGVLGPPGPQGLAPLPSSSLPLRSAIQTVSGERRPWLSSCPSLPPGCPQETHASARSTMVLMSSQRRAESVEQFCRIHSLRSVTTCGREEVALRETGVWFPWGAQKLQNSNSAV